MPEFPHMKYEVWHDEMAQGFETAEKAEVYCAEVGSRGRKVMRDDDHGFQKEIRLKTLMKDADAERVARRRMMLGGRGA